MTRFHNEYAAHDIGTLRTEPLKSGGRQIMEWEFVDRKKPKSETFKVTVHLHLKDGAYAFKAKLDGTATSWENSDIEVLRRQVEKDLMDNAYRLNEMQWEEWLRVEVSGMSSREEDRWRGQGDDLKVQVSRLKKGYEPGTGREFTINGNGLVVPFPKAKDITEASGSGDFMLDTPKTVSYVKNTPENLAAIEDILDRMSALRLQLGEFLSQSCIEDSLARLPKFTALEGPKSTGLKP